MGAYSLLDFAQDSLYYLVGDENISDKKAENCLICFDFVHMLSEVSESSESS